VDPYNRIKQEATQYKVTPPAGSWNKIVGKLDDQVAIRKIRRRKIITRASNIAALFLLYFSVSFIYEESHRDVSVSKGQVSSWEELPDTDNSLLSLDQVRILTGAYDKVLLERSSG